MKKLVANTSLAIFALLPTHALGAVAEYNSPDVKIKDPGTDVDLASIINKFITWVLLLVGGLAVLFVIYGGVLYITSAGNKERVEQAKQTLTYAVIGLIVIVLSKVIVNLVTGTAATAIL